MSPDVLAFQPTTQLARLIALGDVSSVQLVDLYAARHDTFGAQLNAVVQVDFDRARDAAKAADEVLASSEEIGPLHGVPFTIKECFDVAGFNTTAGAPEWAGNAPAANADAVQNLFDAGALCMGKTNVPYMAFDLQSYNDVYGTTNNPWDLSRTCGGSSGGAAAALSAGLTGGDIGSDIGGSLRNPAHYNGVYSHKPTLGLISEYGHVPPAPGTASDTDLVVMGPMGRSAQDLRVLLDVLRRPVGINRDKRISLPPPRATQLEDFRVGLWFGHRTNRPSQAVQAMMDALANALTGNVAALEHVWPLHSSYEELNQVYAQLLLGAVSMDTPLSQFAVATAAHPFLALAQTLGLHDGTGVAGSMMHTAQSHRAWLKAREKQALMRRQIDSFFQDYDVLLAPIIPWTAPPHQHEGSLLSRKVRVDGTQRPYVEALEYIALATTLSLPATTAPLGLAADGLPVGVQIIGPYMHDTTTIAFAEALAQVMGGYQVPPDFKDASALKSP
ncbi:MAG: amidase [Pseudomonadota bacterium]